MEYVREVLGRERVSERQACRVLGQSRATQRREYQMASDEPRLVSRMVELAEEYGRYGYRRSTAFLQREGFRVNHKRVERLWRREGLKVPRKMPKRRRLWDNGAMDRTRDGRALKIMTVIDEYGRECLAIDVSRRITSEEVLERLAQLFLERGLPAYIRSDNGPEFVAKAVREWLYRILQR